MILPPQQQRCRLQLTLSSVRVQLTTYVMSYSKIILKTQATIHPRKTNFLEILAKQESFMF